MLGVGKLRDTDRFNAIDTTKLAKRCFSAIKKISDHLDISGLEWMVELKEKLETGLKIV
ncbi:hypothetical protein BMS3Bbin11_00056 [bacterium BMS3Bbin11]|nr:hypothetical protein BMS3Abin11_00949 [bacterium BMS3Abin11]GBE44977.1 hypothetical protein BMS3Bbin11_00056 [bacterium BMS3Bbin11]